MLHNQLLCCLTLPVCLPASVHQLQHLPALHTAQTTRLPRRSAKGSPLHSDKQQADSPLVLGHQGWGCRGEVSVTACNGICREHFTAAAVVYCRKSSDVGSVQTNPAAGNKDGKVVQGGKKCRSAFVAAAEFNCADCITNSTESPGREATGLQGVNSN